jgi:hypothetical protein
MNYHLPLWVYGERVISAVRISRMINCALYVMADSELSLSYVASESCMYFVCDN